MTPHRRGFIILTEANKNERILDKRKAGTYTEGVKIKSKGRKNKHGKYGK